MAGSETWCDFHDWEDINCLMLPHPGDPPPAKEPDQLHDPDAFRALYSGYCWAGGDDIEVGQWILKDGEPSKDGFVRYSHEECV